MDCFAALAMTIRGDDGFDEASFTSPGGPSVAASYLRVEGTLRAPQNPGRLASSAMTIASPLPDPIDSHSQRLPRALQRRAAPISSTR